MALRTLVELDMLEANAIIAALEQRHRTLVGHIENGVSDEALDAAILHCLRAEDQVRKAFRLATDEYAQRGMVEANAADMDEDDGLVVIPLPDIPLALMTYMGEGR